MHNKYRYGSLFGIDEEELTQYHRASDLRVSYAVPSLKRIKSEIEKKINLKLTGIAQVRLYDVLSHSAKVRDKKKRQYYISLMLGKYLYLDEFVPGCILDNRYYVLAGISPSTFILSATMIKEILACLPSGSCDYRDGRCKISKHAFLAAVHKYSKRRKKSKPNNNRRICREDSDQTGSRKARADARSGHWSDFLQKVE